MRAGSSSTCRSSVKRGSRWPQELTHSVSVAHIPEQGYPQCEELQYLFTTLLLEKSLIIKLSSILLRGKLPSYSQPSGLGEDHSQICAMQKKNEARISQIKLDSLSFPGPPKHAEIGKLPPKAWDSLQPPKNVTTNPLRLPAARLNEWTPYATMSITTSLNSGSARAFQRKPPASVPSSTLNP